MTEILRRSAVALLDPPEMLRRLLLVVCPAVLLVVFVPPVRDLLEVAGPPVLMVAVFAFAWRLGRRFVGKRLGFRGDPVLLTGVRLERSDQVAGRVEPEQGADERGFPGLAPEQARRRLALLYASGTLARLSLFSLFLAVGFALPLPRALSVGLIIQSIAGIAIASFELVPRKTAGRLSDGAAVMALFRPRQEDDTAVVLGAILRYASLGKRPRAWWPDTIWQARLALDRAAANPLHDASAAAGLLAALYYQALDTWKLSAAELYLKAALSDFKRLPAAHADELLREAAFFYADRRGSATQGRAWLQQARVGSGDLLTAARAEAAVLLAEGEFEQAADVAARGLALRLPFRQRRDGIKTWEREQLQRIADDAHRGLVQRAAVPA